MGPNLACWQIGTLFVATTFPGYLQVGWKGFWAGRVPLSSITIPTGRETTILFVKTCEKGQQGGPRPSGFGGGFP